MNSEFDTATVLLDLLKKEGYNFAIMQGRWSDAAIAGRLGIEPKFPSYQNPAPYQKTVAKWCDDMDRMLNKLRKEGNYSDYFPEHIWGVYFMLDRYSKVQVQERTKKYIQVRKALAETTEKSDEVVFRSILEMRFPKFPGERKLTMQEIVRYCIEEAEFDHTLSKWKIYHKGKLYGMPNMSHFLKNEEVWRVQL